MRTMTWMLTTFLVAGPTGDARSNGLDAELGKCVPKIIQIAKEKGYHNIGVLKFLVKKGGAGLSDNVGPLNMTIADRLEVALVLANPSDDLGIIQRASAALVEAGNNRANHLTLEGRKALFETRYPLAWGNRDVAADAFITGEATITPDLQTITVKLAAITASANEPVAVSQFSIPTDARTLAEVGESFVRRGGFDKGTIVITSIAKTDDQPRKHPLEDSPVKLIVLYDGQPTPIRFENGKASVDEPLEGQNVTLALENAGSEKYGIVLSCNGFNTLFKERTDPLLSHKWILKPGDKVTIRGYQMDDRTLAKFKVLSQEETREKEINYNPDVGTLSLAVFRGRPDDEPAEEAPAENGPEVLISRAIQNGAFPKVKPGTLRALQGRLKAAAGEKPEALSRGLVAAGEKVGGSIRRVVFKPEPGPILSGTVYYRRR